MIRNSPQKGETQQEPKMFLMNYVWMNEQILKVPNSKNRINKLLLEFDQNMPFLYLKICHSIGERFPETTLGAEFLD